MQNKDWPDEFHINRVVRNGECEEPVYKYGSTLFRINPVGRYALYSNGKKWIESQYITNETVIKKGVIV